VGKTFVWTKDTTTNALKRNWNHIFSPPHIRRIGEEKIVEGEKTHPARRRGVIERTKAWLKGFRTIRTRYFRNAQNYLAMLHFACAVIIFRKL
jgi:putative transposase